MPRRINVDLEYREKVKEIEAKRQAELAVLEKRFEALLLRAKVWKEKQEAIQAEQKSRKKSSTPDEKDEKTEEDEEHEEEVEDVSGNPMPPVVEEKQVEAPAVDEELERFNKDKKIYEMMTSQNNMTFVVNGEPCAWVQRFIDGMWKYEKRIWNIQGQKLVEIIPKLSPELQPNPPASAPLPPISENQNSKTPGGILEPENPPRQTNTKPFGYMPQTTESIPEFPQILSNTKVKKGVKVVGAR